MPSRRLALLATERGPWVCVHGVEAPHARVVGLPAGVEIIVVCTDDPNKADHDSVHRITENGIHEVRATTWMQVTASRKARSLIVEIITRRAA
jgi:hypothetical protein